MIIETPIAAPLHHPLSTELARTQRTLPLDDPDRHDLEDPALEDAFAHLAIDHPDQVGGRS